MIIYILYHSISSIFHRRDKKVLTLLVYLLEFIFYYNFYRVCILICFFTLSLLLIPVHIITYSSINYILNFNLCSLLCCILFYSALFYSKHMYIHLSLLVISISFKPIIYFIKVLKLCQSL